MISSCDAVDRPGDRPSDRPDVVDRHGALRSVLALTLAGACSVPAHAQTTAGGLEEIVVTAQRREQNLQDTPVSVTAVAGDVLTERNIQDLNALGAVVPGFSIRDGGPAIQYNLRGYISTDPRANSDSPIAVYIDDVFLGGSVLTYMQALDVSRIEALRGPQGTLFGRNATGGLVHFVSNQPSDELGGQLALQLGDYDQRIVDAAIGGPLSDRLAGRAAVKYNYNGGWQKNLLGGDNRDSKDALAGRVQLRWDISDNLAANFSFQANRERNQYPGFSSFGTLHQAGTELCNYQQIRALNCYLGGAAFSNVAAGTRSLAEWEPDRIYSTMRSSPDDFDAYLGIVRFDWTVSDNLTLSSISAVADADRSFTEDDNATGIPQNNPFNFLSHDAEANQFSQELRATGSTASDWNYVAGLYYFTSEKKSVTTVLDSDANDVIFYSTPNETLDTDSIAAYGQLEIPLSDSLRGIVGARITHEKKTLERQLHPGFINIGPVVSLPDSSGSNTEPTGKIGLQWLVNDSLNVYGHVSTGFKSAEYPVDKADEKLKLVDPEEITAIELGMKAQLMDDRAQLNAAVFSNKIKNKQSTTSIRDPDSGAQVPYFINFGDVDQKGIELDASVRPVESLLLAASLSYVDNEVDPINGVSIQRLAFFNEFALDGNELPGAAPFQAYASAVWTLPLPGDGKWDLGVDWRWVDKTYWNLSNNEMEIEPAYDVGDIRVQYTSSDERWRLGAFVNNVTNTEYGVVNFSFGGSDALTVTWAKPRWYGVRAEFNF